MMRKLTSGLLAMLLLLGCNKSQPLTEAEQKEAYWQTNTFCLYGAQNPNMRLSLNVPNGLYQADKKQINANKCIETTGVTLWKQPEELEAFVAKDTEKLVQIDKVRKDARGDRKKYDGVAHEIEIQISMRSEPIDLIYIEKRLKEKKMNNELVFDKNWLVSVSPPRKMIYVPNKMTATVTLSHKNGLRVFMFAYDQIDGEKISPKRDQIIKNVIAMVNNFNPELSK